MRFQTWKDEVCAVCDRAKIDHPADWGDWVKYHLRGLSPLDAVLAWINEDPELDAQAIADCYPDHPELLNLN
jgi:hypothetical protein